MFYIIELTHNLESIEILRVNKGNRVETPMQTAVLSPLLTAVSPTIGPNGKNVPKSVIMNLFSIMSMIAHSITFSID